MVAEHTTIESGPQLLSELAHSGVAETLTRAQRREIHIPTELDKFLDNALENDKQVILTGNPGDGKTQQILIEQERYPADEYFYLLDASTYADYSRLLDEWQESFESGQGGILAINDGPLYEMVTQQGDKYPFLKTVREQLENQIVYTDGQEEIEAQDIIVVDLNNRNILVPDIIDEAIRRLAENIAKKSHDHGGVCHIQHNARKIADHTHIRDNLIDLLIQAGQLSDHVTVRDLVNFLSYCITGGYTEGLTEYGEEVKYYNLAFSGEGKLFNLFREHFDPGQLTHPFVDNQLWTEAEKEINPRDEEDSREEIEDAFLRKKRRFLFEDESMMPEYESRELYQSIHHDFLNHRNRDLTGESSKEDLIQRINGYFLPNDTNRSELRLWLSHRYRSKSSLALVSRTKVPKGKFSLERPKLNRTIRKAIEYSPSHLILEYSNESGVLRLRVTRELFSSLNALDSNVPYTLRDRDEEQQLLEFMEEIEYYESYSQESGQIVVRDTESGNVVEVEVNGGKYRI